MKGRHIIISAMIFFAACRSAPKPLPGKDSIPSLAGYYESSDTTRLIALTLRRSGDVEMLTDSLNSTPEKIQIGNWMRPDSNNNNILITLITIGNDPSHRDTLPLQWSPDSSFQSSATVFTKKQRPAPAEKMLVFYLKNEQQCDRGPGFGKTPCYDVQYGEKLSDNWQRFSEPIDSFKFEKGFLYKLKVRRIPRDSSVQEIGAYRYQLAEVLEKRVE